jgi:hypothetical protein
MRAAVPFAHQPRAPSDPFGSLFGYHRARTSRLDQRCEFSFELVQYLLISQAHRSNAPLMLQNTAT